MGYVIPLEPSNPETNTLLPIHYKSYDWFEYKLHQKFRDYDSIAIGCYNIAYIHYWIMDNVICSVSDGEVCYVYMVLGHRLRDIRMKISINDLYHKFNKCRAMSMPLDTFLYSLSCDLADERQAYIFTKN